MASISSVSTGRIKTIDQFRGVAIILMVVFNYLSGIETIPSWLKHVPDIGMNFPDLGTPVFIFAIGLTYGLSYRRRREKDGLKVTLGHFLRRYLAFLGLGAIITAGRGPGTDPAPDPERFGSLLGEERIYLLYVNLVRPALGE